MLPFSLRKDEFQGSIELELLNRLYYHEMRDIEITVMNKKVPVSDIFENGSSDYRIPVIIYDHKTKAKQIRRVFKRYNTQGAKLNPTEVNNAAYQDLKAMKLNLALSRVRPERGEELLQGVYDDWLKTPSIDVEGLYKSWNLSSKRFEWAKLNSVILAILHFRIDRKSNDTHNYPSTSGLIKQYFESEESGEAMTISRIKKLAAFFSNGAKSLLDPLIMEEFKENPSFYHPSSPTNWSQPTAIAIMVAAILCESEGVNLSEKIYDEDILTNFSDFVKSNESLGQTQADGQWRYYAKIIIDFCAIFGLTKDNFSDRESLFDGYNLLEYLGSIPPEVLE
jgi:CRISPR/Cas system CSM-associated protein Csm2 small subunit